LEGKENLLPRREKGEALPSYLSPTSFCPRKGGEFNPNEGKFPLWTSPAFLMLKKGGKRPFSLGRGNLPTTPPEVLDRARHKRRRQRKGRPPEEDLLRRKAYSSSVFMV